MQRVTVGGALTALLAGSLIGIPAASAEAPHDADPVSGRAVYEYLCSRCHNTGQGGAPRPGDAAYWTQRQALDADALYQHALEGYRSMPASGGEARLRPEDVRAAARYLVSGAAATGAAE